MWHGSIHFAGKPDGGCHKGVVRELKNGAWAGEGDRGVHLNTRRKA